MRCPKCGYVSFNYLDRCKKCGRDLTAFKAEHNLWGIKPGTLSIYSSIQQAVEQGESLLGPSIEEVPELEEDLLHGIEMIEEEEEDPAVPQDALSAPPSEEELEGIHLELEEIELGGGEPEEKEAVLELEEEAEDASDLINLDEIELSWEEEEEEEDPGKEGS